MALLYYYYLFSFFLTIAAEHGEALHNQDLRSLLSFKASVDPLNTLLYTWEGSNPCFGLWVGIKCYRGRVVSIDLDDASLVGSATPLFGLSQLQVLSLRRNALNGSLPHLTNLTNPGLRHLFLSHNQLDGALNISLPSLLSLRIEHNFFSGRLEGLQLPVVEDFNVSVNHLAGEIPGSLSRFSSSAFNGNPALCGPPLPDCGKISHLFNASNTSPSPAPIIPAGTCSRNLSKLGLTTLLAIGIGDMVAIAMALGIVIGMYIWFKRRFLMPPNAVTGTRGLESDHGFVEGKEMDGRLVCFEGGEDLRLDSLLKASAEVLGKGISGSTYKAVLEDGIMVAVKRLSAVQFPSHSKAFNQRMRLIGRLRHSHVVSLRAYCNAHEEKLLVYDYMPNGSLQSLLRSKGGCRNLDWGSRKRILMGAAHGLNFFHTFPARPPLVHANIKPSNILIDEQSNACITECSIMCFATNFHQSLMLPHASNLLPERLNSAATSNWHGYRAPELSAGKGKATQESDVYSFGMVLLEVVTDKEIDDGECEGEMMGMVKIGMMCTAECPEERPKMSQVLRTMSDFL